MPPSGPIADAGIDCAVISGCHCVPVQIYALAVSVLTTLVVPVGSISMPVTKPPPPTWIGCQVVSNAEALALLRKNDSTNNKPLDTENLFRGIVIFLSISGQAICERKSSQALG